LSSFIPSAAPYRTFPATIPFNNGGFKGDSFEFWHLKHYFARSRCQVSVVMPGTIPLTRLCTLLFCCFSQVFSFLIQQIVQRFLNTTAHQLFEFSLDDFLVQLYNFWGHVCLLLSVNGCVVTSFFRRTANLSFFGLLEFAKFIVPYPDVKPKVMFVRPIIPSIVAEA